MRIYRIVSMVSVPDEIAPMDILASLDEAIDGELGGKKLSNVISEISDEALPTPEAPVETIR